MDIGLKTKIAPAFFRFALAVCVAAAVIALRFAVNVLAGPGLPTYILFYPAVMAAALLAGFAPGIAATAILAFAAVFWFIPPFGELKIDSAVDRLGVLIFICMSVLMCVLAESYRRNRDKAAAYDREAAALESVDKSRGEIRSSEERYRTLFNALIEGFCIVEMVFDRDNRPVDYRFLEVNEAFEAQTGLRDAAGKLMRELAPEHEQYWFDIYGKVAATGEPERFINEAKALNRWYDVHAFRVGGNDSRRVAICFKDITVPKKAEDMLRESEQRLKFHFENSPLAVVEWDADFIVTQWSSEAEKIYEWKKEETLGKRIDTLNIIYEEDIPIVNSTMERLTSGKEHMVVSSNRNYTKSGRIIECAWYNSVLLDKEGKMSSVMSLVQDITEIKRAEEVLKRDNETFLKIVLKKSKKLIETQLELEKAKRLSDIGMLSATVAHELRNPMAVIGVAAYNIKRKIQDPAIDRHLASIEKKIEEGGQIINNLLFYSRLRPPSFEKTRVFELLEESMAAMLDKQMNPVPITPDIGAVSGLDIDADPVQLREVFNNLLNNAYDAIPAEGGRITVIAEKQQGNVKIVFHNNGEAIPGENLNKIFDPFFTTKTKGTGLGLSVCRQIIDFHKGSISAESSPSTGTDFTVTLPIQR